MNKIFWQILITVPLLLTACVQSTSVIDNATVTPSSIQTTTQIAFHTETPTATITPLPIIPTFAPTFDTSTIVKVTPAQKAECPKENPLLIPKFQIPIFPSCTKNGSCNFDGGETGILDFLNQGGLATSVINRLHNAYKSGTTQQYAHTDVTGDSVADLIFIDFGLIPDVHVFYCQNGIYKLFSYGTKASGVDIKHMKLNAVEDLNEDGMPEILISHDGCSVTGCFGFFTLEWQGNSFRDLSPEVGMFGVKDFRWKDLDKNGTHEIVIIGDQPDTWRADLAIPWRYLTIVYTWDGKFFSQSYEYYTSPKYRFQAIQDGDRETMYRNFDKAMAFYQDAISNDKLEWWSQERRDYEATLLTQPARATPAVQPSPDTTEYPRLAAYAYYRIMLINLTQEQESDATIIYNTLQQKFGGDQYGHPYVEMATAFWNAFQSTHKMYAGCAAAIKYAVEHTNILLPLGSSYHGMQSKTYEPGDVCPFR